MKLSNAQRELLLKMHGGECVVQRLGGRYYGERGYKVLFRHTTACVLVSRGLAAETTADGRLTLTPAGRELAEKIKEQA